jgi:hypothetical protein
MRKISFLRLLDFDKSEKRNGIILSGGSDSRKAVVIVA